MSSSKINLENNKYNLSFITFISYALVCISYFFAGNIPTIYELSFYADNTIISNFLLALYIIISLIYALLVVYCYVKCCMFILYTVSKLNFKIKYI